MNAHIYLVTNTINNKQYVGQSVVGRNKVGHGLIITEAYKRYGRDSFLYDRIATGIDNRDTLNFLERLWIKVFDCRAPNGYNIEMGGSDKGEMAQSTKDKLRKAFLGRPMPEETKRKISASMRGENSPFYGRKHTPEAIAKIVAANIGKTVIITKEQKRKIGAANAGKNNGMYGKKHTEETKKKFAGRVPSKYWLGKKLSEEARSRMSAAKKQMPNLECPHCGKVGGFHGMKVHHFDNCKKKVVI